MASDFPTAVDSFNDPTATDTLDSPDHAVLHQDVNDGVEKTQTKLGTGATTPTSGAVLVGDGAGSSAWDTSPANLTLDTPTLNTPDLNGTELILDADGDTSITADTDDQIDIKLAGADDFQLTPNKFSVLSGSNVEVADAVSISDDSSNELITFSKVASAVNEITVENAVTTESPEIQATGDDTNIDVDIIPKGTGEVTKAGNPIDWWEEIGRTTLGVAGDTITASSLSERTYLKIIINVLATGGTIGIGIRFNNDSGTNYARRISDEGAADASASSQTSLLIGTTGAWNQLGVLELTNMATSDKIAIGHQVGVNTTGGGSVPRRQELAGKWGNTSDQITRVDIVNGGTGDFAIGSELIVLGHN